MISSEVQRTLVKSPPELWAELSDPASLARHLGELGEIHITRVEPEKLVEWEATDTTGKVLLKPSGWGTKVTLTAARELAAPEPPPEPEPSMEVEPEPEPEPMVAEEPEPEPRPGFFARLFRRRPKKLIQPEPEQPTIIEVDEPERPQDEDSEGHRRGTEGRRGGSRGRGSDRRAHRGARPARRRAPPAILAGLSPA